MGLELVPLLPVLGKSLAAPLLAIFVRGYKLGDAWESVAAFGDRITQVDEQVPGLDIVGTKADRDRRRQILLRVTGKVMRHETSVAKRPQQLVDALCERFAVGLNMHGIVAALRFFGEPAANGRPCQPTAITQH